MREADPVDRALQSLGGRHWPGETHNPQLENQLMRAFETHKPASLISRHRVLIPVLAVLVFGSVAFAAAGGIEYVRSLFITVSVNGEVVDTSEVVLDENGRGTFTRTHRGDRRPSDPRAFARG